MTHLLPFQHRFGANRRRGSALVATLLVVLALVTFLSIGALVTSQFGRYASRQMGDSDLLAAGDAALEYAYGEWKYITNAAIGKGAPPTNVGFPPALNNNLLANMRSNSTFAAKGVTFTALSIQMTDPTGYSPDASAPAIGSITSNVPNYPGWSGRTYTYVAQVTVTPSPNSHFGFGGNGNPAITLKRLFQVTEVPLFQAAIFYENKLELHPGAAMIVTGLIHTNADLWMRGFDQLRLMNNVSYVTSEHEIGDASVSKGEDGYGYGIIPGIGAYAGVPQVTWNDGLPSSTSKTRATQLNPVSPIDPFGGTLQTNNGLHDMIEVPTAATTIPTNEIAYDNSSLIITVNSSLPASNANQIVVTDGSGKALSAVDALAVKNAVTVGSTNTLYDQREASYVTVTSLDMAKLAVATVPATGAASLTSLQSAFANTNGTPSGMVYIQDASTTTSTEKGIRLINGSNLKQNVTIASNNAVYIQGDYNTGGTGTAVPSNKNNDDGTASPNVPGTTRYASAVMADAVTILSNNWSDSNSAASISSRTAAATTVNTAIMSGDVPSNLNGNLTSSGGAHNFPRFLENWSNINFTYWGSLVEAFRSEKFDGTWQTGNVYYWPNRKWNFDTNFLTTQPPGVPNGVQYSRGRWQRNSS